MKRNKNMKPQNILENSQKLFLIILFTVMTIVFFLLAFLFSQTPLAEGKSFDDDRNTIYATVHIDITSLPIAFETIATEQNGTFYITGSGENIYIVKLSKKQYQKIREEYENNPADFTYRIVGRTYRIFTNLENASQSAYNEDKGAAIVKSANYEEYFGQAYIDGTENMGTSVSVVFSILGGVLLLATLLSIVEYVHVRRKLKQAIKEHGRETLEELLEDPQVLAYQNAGAYLSRQYLISNSVGFKVIPYDDIFWIYIEQMNPIIPIGKYIMAATMDGKCQPVVFGKNQKVLEEIISKIHEKNPAVRVGYSKDNQRSYREFFHQNR